MPEFKSQKELIHKREWDCLVILDACRYDYFKKLYGDYLEGNLQKVLSPACWTVPWLKENFQGEYHDNLVYISGTPHVNSYGKKLGGFSGRKWFHKIIDVWDRGWNEEIGTVHPKKMGEATRQARAKYPKKRLISHFVQPHEPYLSLGPFGKVPASHFAAKGEKKKHIPALAKRFIKGKIDTFLEWMGLHEIANVREEGVKFVSQKYNDKVLHKAYKENLKSALKEVKKLSKRLPRKMIVTTDHGELLGEDGRYGHGKYHPVLEEVPWLEVNSYL